MPVGFGATEGEPPPFIFPQAPRPRFALVMRRPPPGRGASPPLRGARPGTGSSASRGAGPAGSAAPAVTTQRAGERFVTGRADAALGAGAKGGARFGPIPSPGLRGGAERWRRGGR